MNDSQHVFISYARKDGKIYAEKLDNDLKSHIKTWRDTRDIDPNQDFSAELENAIEAASHVICCITPDVKRENSFVRREIGYAMRLRKPLIPLIFEGTIPPISIINVTEIDFTRQAWDQAKLELLARLQREVDLTYEQVQIPDDPYREYLHMLYELIVNYLSSTVFSLLTLKAEAIPEAVEKRTVLPMTFFAMAGIEDKNSEKIHFDNFSDAYMKYKKRILLLGEPGAGKTTTLFAFTRDIIVNRLADPNYMLPILVPISTWNSDKQISITEWLVEQVATLKTNDLIPMMTVGKVLLLLDGLDELGDERQDSETNEKYDPRIRFMEMIAGTSSQAFLRNIPRTFALRTQKCRDTGLA